MGSGSKFQINFSKESIGLGLHISRFPHQVSIAMTVLFVNIYIGLGKGYDE